MANYNVSGLMVLAELATLKDQPWFVYIISCNDQTLYTGVTNNIEKRLFDHENGRGAKYTKGRGPLQLVYREKFLDRSSASQREYQIKKMSRLQKLSLIDKQ